LPVRGGVVLSVEQMTAIKEISADDMVAVVEPGVITQTLQNAVEEQGLFYPPELSGEHGIGLTKRDFVHLEHSEQLLEWQRRWKRMWDPSNLLNPGKKIPNGTKRCSE
jgi:FAD/FMN-containing dehydrogenase